MIHEHGGIWESPTSRMRLHTHVHEGVEDTIFTYKREEVQYLWKRLETFHGQNRADQSEPNAQVPKWWDSSSLPPLPSPVVFQDVSIAISLVSNFSDLLLCLYIHILLCKYVALFCMCKMFFTVNIRDFLSLLNNSPFYWDIIDMTLY